MIKVRKSTIGDWNRGYTTMKANCYYKGKAICWVLYDENNPEGHIALDRKKDAENMAIYLNEINYNGNGDCFMIFQKHLAEIEDWETLDKIKEI